MTHRQEFSLGFKTAAPVIVSYIPVGIAYAVIAQQAGFSTTEIISMSFIVFAGASQIMAAGMIAQGAGIAAVILATFVINLRHLIMSTCVTHKIQDNKMSLKLLASFGITDEASAIFTTMNQKNATLFFYLGMAVVTYSGWVLSSALGAFAAALLPAVLSASLSIAIYALFIGLIMPNVTKNLRLALLVVATALFNTLLSQFLAPSWALIVSTLLCAAIGVYFVDLEEETEK